MTDRAPSLPSPFPSSPIDLADPNAGALRLHAGAHRSGGAPLLLIHSVNAAASSFEVRPLFEHFAGSRPTYALDLPGFAHSDRSARTYTPRIMTDAIHAAVAEIGRRHDGLPMDAVALSLSSEFLARAAAERPAGFRTLALVSPTGFNGAKRLDGPEGSTRAIPGMHAIVSASLWDDALYGLLTRPKVIRYFLERTWGSPEIDEALWAYDVVLARQPGAKNAPLYFLAGHLFSKDVSTLYDALEMPVWMCHGVRGDFVDYRGAEAMRRRPNWRIEVFQTGAFPHFEVPGLFFPAYEAFLAG